jgi:very-short-patch-repair endonuclease
VKTAKDLKRFQREMRRKPTPSERAFASRLLEAGLDFKQQMILGFFILDFVFPAHMVVIELDGAVHDDPAKSRYDHWRDEFIEQCGFIVLRLTNKESVTYDVNKIPCYGSATVAMFRSALGMGNAMRSKAIHERRQNKLFR